MNRPLTLLAELARLLRLVDPMPPRVLADAEAARRHLPVFELAVLADAVPACRSAGRRLRLGPPGGEPVLELEIRQVATRLRLAGLAPRGARLDVDGAGADTAVPVDAAGYFTCEVPDAPLRLTLTWPDGRAAATGWL
jgi:hypothetical protein